VSRRVSGVKLPMLRGGALLTSLAAGLVRTNWPRRLTYDALSEVGRAEALESSLPLKEVGIAK
jgi:hypothetical protein